VVEVMGRHVGWIATHAGIAGGADFVLVPDHPRPVDDVIRTIKARHDRGAEFSIIVVAEGYHLEGSPDAEIDEFGHERLAELDVGERLAMLLEARTGFETRSVVLGHLQRGGSPNAYDRLLATRFGAYAAKLVDQRGFGQMASVSGNRIVDVPLAEAVKELKRVPDALYAVCDRLSSVPGGP
jgi:6-phosphofructokinase